MWRALMFVIAFAAAIGVGLNLATMCPNPEYGADWLKVVGFSGLWALATIQFRGEQ